jgi:hypothetical protein
MSLFALTCVFAGGDGLDLDDAVGEAEGGFQGVGQARPQVVAHDQPIDHDLDRVLAVLVQVDLLAELAERAVDAHARIALPLEIEEQLLVLALAPAHDRRQHQQARARRQREDAIDHLLDGLGGDDAAALRTVRDTDAREENAQVVVDLGDGADRRARILGGRLLLDRDGRRQALDRVDVRLLHLLEELPRVRRQRLDVAALSLGVDRVERQRRLPGAGQAGEHHQLVTRDLDVDAFQIVLAGSTDDDPVTSHDRTIMPQLGTGSPAAAGDGSARVASQPSGIATSAG